MLLFSTIGMLKSATEYIPLDPLYIKYYRGSIGLQGVTRVRSNDPQLYFIMGNIKLNTSFFLWDPEIWNFDIIGEYSPNINIIKIPALPDVNEILNTNQLNFQTSLFNTSSFTTSIFGDLSSSNSKRDFVYNVKNISYSYGVSSTFSNIILPLSLSYSKSMNKDIDLNTNLDFKNNSDVYNISATRDIGDFNSNNFNVSYSKNSASYIDTVNSKNEILGLSLINTLFPLNFFFIASSTNLLKVKGAFGYDRFDETISSKLDLPEKFSLNCNWNYSKINYDSSTVINNYPKLLLSHFLYSNLSSQLFFEKTDYKQIANNIEKNTDNKTMFGAYFNYTKRIPTGRFGITYNYKQNNTDQVNRTSGTSFRNEEYIMDDSKTILLKNPDIILGSIIVKDVTGTIVYQNNIDYLIINDSLYTQIIRIPSGRITNNSRVYIDYIALLASRSKYSLINNGLGSSISLFDGFLSLYYNYNEVHYKNIEVQNTGILRTENTNSFGLNINYLGILFNGNYTSLKSNISPYRSTDFNISASPDILDGLSSYFSTSVSLILYDQTKNTNLNAFANLRLTYGLSNSLYVNFHYNFRYSKIINMNMKYMNAKLELRSIFLQTMLSIGIDYYNNMYYSNSANAYGAYIRLERAFGYF